jgi:hypothetical protein
MAYGLTSGIAKLKLYGTLQAEEFKGYVFMFIMVLKLNPDFAYKESKKTDPFKTFILQH